jgi:lipoprotein-releasing system permease protein
MISQFTADRLNLKIREILLSCISCRTRPVSRKFKIVGIYSVSALRRSTKNFVIGDLNLIRRLNNWKAK